MKIRASIKNALTTPQKVRLVLDTVRGKTVLEAEGILRFENKKAARIVRKLLDSAVANAIHNFGIPKDNLFIESIQANEGLVLKRWMPRAHGHATQILKKRSHLILDLGEIDKSKEEIVSRKSKIETVSYEEVKKAMAEAEKASKLAEKATGKKKETDKTSDKKTGKPDEKDSKFGKLSGSFKGLKGMLRRTGKKV